MTRGITASTATTGSAPVRRGARGSISRLPSGSLRVQVYAGSDPIIGHTIPYGPAALEQAEATCRRLLTLVRDRQLRLDVTLTELLDRHLALMHAGEHPRRSHRWMVTKHVHPLLGHRHLAEVTPQLLDLLYASCCAAETTATTQQMTTSVGRCTRRPSGRSIT